MLTAVNWKVVGSTLPAVNRQLVNSTPPMTVHHLRGKLSSALRALFGTTSVIRLPIRGGLSKTQPEPDREKQCKTTEEGTLWCVAHRLIKIQADRNLVAWQVSLFPFSVYIPL